MELPPQLIAALEQLKQELQSAAGGSPEDLARLLDPFDETRPVETPSRPTWKQRLATWWRKFKNKVSSGWDRATRAIQRLVQRLAAQVARLAGRNNRDWIIAGLVIVAAVAVVFATVKSFALIVALLAAFGLLAVIRIIQRLQKELAL